ncbi:glycosyltransferase family 4 protein [Cellulomonas sp. PhB143]|uniref:glycosyltransferase family 4 protein n=1 Tax=Cellulomonas sp. PhB143 TaxID=2485186 RepID=UPI000FBE0161|nr:glycosyltransferase family 4 protein [Cellulomonas sp. PhB143]ROS79000.1 glycosyltransferase involved in cell wall biosynthesis [Cellulomonas sp. PhB143]
MRIVHVTDCFAPRTGGIESQVGDLAAAQARAGDEVHVTTATFGAQGQHGGAVEETRGVRVHRLGSRFTGGLPVNPWSGPRLMRAVLRDVRPDVVHVHAGLVAPFAYDGARTARAAGIPTVVTWHSMLDGGIPVLRAGSKVLGWRSSRMVPTAVSHAAARRVEKVLGLAPGEVPVVPDAIDVAAWHAVAARRETDPAAPVRFVTTMRLEPRKRGRHLVEAFAQALRALPDGAARLTIIGAGSEDALLRSRVARLGLGDRVTMAGRLTREEVTAAYATADVFCSPAILEAFGIAALEARSAGLAVVARRGTGVEEFVDHEVEGLLVSSDDELAGAMVRLVRDRALLGRLLEHNRDHAPRFTWDVVTQRAAEAYAEASARG